jgi:hypothetical protein
MPKPILTPTQLTILRALRGIVPPHEAARALGINRCTASFHMDGKCKTEIKCQISIAFAKAIAQNLLNAEVKGLEAMAKALRATANDLDAQAIAISSK